MPMHPWLRGDVGAAVEQPLRSLDSDASSSQDGGTAAREACPI